MISVKMKITIAYLLHAFIAFAYAFPSNSSLLESKIVGGVLAKIRVHRHLVSIRNSGGPFCTGSLISYRHILTACYCAHVVEQARNNNYKDHTIHAGSNHLTKYGHFRDIVGAECHPGNEFGDVIVNPNDIGVILVKYDFPIVNTIRVIPYYRGPLWKTISLTAPGWGFSKPLDLNSEPPIMSEDLTLLQIRLVSNNTCVKFFSIDIEKQMCGSGYYGDALSEGDVGTSLVHEHQLIGVAAYSKFVLPLNPRECLTSLYSRVLRFEFYINRAMARLDETFRRENILAENKNKALYDDISMKKRRLRKK